MIINRLGSSSTSLLCTHSRLTCFYPFLLEPRSTYSGRQLLVGYWGQNGAGPSSGPANYEKSLLEVCQTTKYDILAVSFLIIFFDLRQGGIYFIYLFIYLVEEISL